MDTKSTSIRYSAWFKLLAVLLGLAGVTISFFGMLRANDYEYGIQSNDYLNSKIFYNEVNYKIRPYIIQLWDEESLFTNQEGYLSDEKLNELAVKVDEARQAAQRLQEEAEMQAQREIEAQAQREAEAARLAGEKRASAEELMQEAQQIEANAGIAGGVASAEAQPAVVDETEARPAEELVSADAGQAAANTTEARQADAGQELPGVQAAGNTIKTDTASVSVPIDELQITIDNYENAPDYYSLLQMRNSLEGIKGLHYSVLADNKVYGYSVVSYKALPYSQSFEGSEGTTIYIGFNRDAFAEFEARRLNGLNGIYMLGGGLLLSLLAMIWLIYTAGRSRRNEGILINLFDRIAFLDIGLCATAILVFLAVSLWVNTFQNNFVDFFTNIRRQVPFNIVLFYSFSIILFSSAYLLVLLFMITLSKRFKRSEVVRHTIIYKLCTYILHFFSNIFKGIRSGLDAGPIAVKAVILLIAYGIIGGGICFLALVTTHGANGFFFALLFYIAITAAAIRFMSKRLAGFKTLADGVRSVRNGSLDFNIPVSGSHALDSVISDVNNISAGLKAAVDTEMKAERMKVELITNVSHDLRTPLTSIITYADLLYADDVTPEQVKEYSGILKSKSDKLKLLVDDLFEVSKAQSGTMPLDLEILNLNDLLTQTMAEYQEGFENSKLEIKINAPEEKVNIIADGSRMWRVLSNIFSNIVKYSMPGTRVYIDIISLGSKASVIFRNISGSPMNFKSGEIFERFRRGDESRSGEGFGLGLAIVKSFMDIQKGSCGIIIDGDLFKLTLDIPLAQS